MNIKALNNVSFGKLSPLSPQVKQYLTSHTKTGEDLGNLTAMLDNIDKATGGEEYKLDEFYRTHDKGESWSHYMGINETSSGEKLEYDNAAILVRLEDSPDSTYWRMLGEKAAQIFSYTPVVPDKTGETVSKDEVQSVFTKYV